MYDQHRLCNDDYLIRREGIVKNGAIEYSRCILCELVKERRQKDVVRRLGTFVKDGRQKHVVG